MCDAFATHITSTMATNGPLPPFSSIFTLQCKVSINRIVEHDDNNARIRWIVAFFASGSTNPKRRCNKKKHTTNLPIIRTASATTTMLIVNPCT